MRILLLSALTAISSFFAGAEPPLSENAISGTIEILPDAHELDFGVQRSTYFDREQIQRMAEAAKKDGDYETAFHHYWAVCDAGRADSCVEAAMLSDTGLVTQIPTNLIKHLYDRACNGGLEGACGLPLH